MRPSNGLSRFGSVLDGIVAVALVGNLVWTTWNLGGAMIAAMAWSFPVLMATLALVVLRWTVVAPTGFPMGWWWPLPMLGYVALHVFWLSPTPGRAVLDGLEWVWMAAAYGCGLHVARQAPMRRIVGSGIGLTCLVIVGAAIYQRVGHAAWLPVGRTQVDQYLNRSGGTFGVPNNMAAWTLMVIPVAGAAAWTGIGLGKWGRRFAATVAVAGGIGLALSISRGGWLAFAVAMMVWPLLKAASSWRRRLTWAASVAAAVIVAASIGYVAVPEVKARTDAFVQDSGETTRPMMWRAAWGIFRDRPWVGSGGGSYAVVIERHRPMGFRDAPEWAHNDYLNTLSDYGLVGFGLSFGVAGLGGGFCWLMRRHGRVDTRPKVSKGFVPDLGAMGIGLFALALATVVDFHLKIPAVAMLAGLMVAAWVSGDDMGYDKPRSDGSDSLGLMKIVGGVGGAVVLIGFGVGWARPRLQSEAMRGEARTSIDRCAQFGDSNEWRKLVEPALVELEQAVVQFPESDRAWGDLAYGRALQVHWDPTRPKAIGIAAEEAARNALARSDVDWEHWIRLGVALDLQNRWLEAGLAFGKAVRIAPRRALVWYYQAFHLSLNPVMEPVTKSVLATCLRLDPGLTEAEALRAALANSP